MMTGGSSHVFFEGPQARLPHLRRKILGSRFFALAMFGAFPASDAFAQSVVTLYGRFFPQFNVLESRGATPAGTAVSTLAVRPTGENVLRHNEVDANSSRMGFRGSEDLGGGLKAIWQMESRVRLDGGNSQIADRDSHVGLSGAFGSVIMGRWRTPYRFVAGVETFMGISQSSIVSPSIIFSTPGLRNDGAAGFHRREQNTVQYWSPKLGPLNFRVGYTPDEAKTLQRNREVFSTGAAYEMGPISMTVGYEVHNDLFGGSRSSGLASGTQSRDTGARVVLTWADRNAKISAAVERLKYKETGAAANGFASYERDAFGIYATYKIGNLLLAAMANIADNGKCARVAAACSTSELGAKQLALGAKYSLSRRTELFTYYTTLRNEASASYTMTDLVSPGTDFSGFALGISHSF